MPRSGTLCSETLCSAILWLIPLVRNSLHLSTVREWRLCQIPGNSTAREREWRLCLHIWWSEFFSEYKCTFDSARRYSAVLVEGFVHVSLRLNAEIVNGRFICYMNERWTDGWKGINGAFRFGGSVHPLRFITCCSSFSLHLLLKCFYCVQSRCDKSDNNYFAIYNTLWMFSPSDFYIKIFCGNILFICVHVHK